MYTEVVPLVNLVSVQDLSVTVDVDHDRSSLNANFYFKGLAACREFHWVGTNIMLESARFEVVTHTKRCAALSVNLTPATRDHKLPRSVIESSGV